MFMARPINLKVEVWDRIDEYLNKKAEEDRSFKPNRSLFLEEAAIFYLDSLDKPAEEESTEEEDSFDLGVLTRTAQTRSPARRAPKRPTTTISTLTSTWILTAKRAKPAPKSPPWSLRKRLLKKSRLKRSRSLKRRASGSSRYATP
jgi:hypothetical protein